MSGNHDNIRPVADLLYRLFNRCVCRFKGRVGDPLLIGVPDRNIRCAHAYDSQSDTSAFNDRITAARDIIALIIQDICREHRERGLREDFLHCFYPPVKLMISHGHRIITHIIHGGHDGMFLVRLFIGNIVRHDRALDIVPRIQKKHCRLLLADLLYAGIQPGHSVVFGLGIVLIGIAPDIAVHIRGTQYHKMNIPCLIRPVSLCGGGRGSF